MLQARISAYFFLTCFALFIIGAVFTFPPHSDGWQLDAVETNDILRGKTTLELEGKLEDKLSYKDYATKFWGSIRYALFNTGSSGVIIGEDGWLFTKEEFETEANAPEIIRENTQKIYRALATLEANDIATVFVWIPAKARHHKDKLDTAIPPAIHQTLTPPSNRPFVDGNVVFQNIEQPFMRTDTHWSQEGTKAMAEAVSRFVTLHYPDLELTPKEFATIRQSSGIKTGHLYEGDLAEFVPSYWFTGPTSFFGYGREIIQKYETNAAADTTASLFDDEVIDVTLIGTSYSAQQDWHFEGFLKTALQADILNLADEGKGPFAPMEAFLKELPSMANKPKLVIWEFPERYLIRPADEKTDEEQS